MGKAILVIDDTPESCLECPLSVKNDEDVSKDYCQATKRGLFCELRKPDWCPLKEIPDKKSELSTQSGYTTFSEKWWNAYINSIFN